MTQVTIMALQPDASTKNDASHEEQLFSKFISYINGYINYFVRDDLSNEQQGSYYEPTLTNTSLANRFHQYMKLIISHQSLPPIQHQFALNLFHDLIMDINKYILSLVETIFNDQNKDLQGLAHKILISKVLAKSFQFTFKISVFNKDVHDNQANIITLQPLLFCGNNLIQKQSNFKQFIQSFYDECLPSPDDDLLQISTYFKVNCIMFIHIMCL